MLHVLSMLMVVQGQTSFLGNIMCGMCQKQIQQFTANFSSKHVNKKDLTEHCAPLVPNNPKECDEVAKVMFQTMIKSINSTDVCSAFHFCSKKRELIEPKETLSVTKETLQKKYNDKCELCQDMYGYLFGEGVDEFVVPTTQSIIMKNFGNNNLTRRFASRINNSTNIRYFISTIPMDYTRYEFCQKAGLCDAPQIGIDL